MVFMLMVVALLILVGIGVRSMRTVYLLKPEENHLIGEGVYFNVFTQETRDKIKTGTIANVNEDTIFYASIQNAGKDRHMTLKAYINYRETLLEFLNTSDEDDNIYLKDGDNILIPFKIKTELDEKTNYKMLISLFWGTDQYEAETKFQTSMYAMSYDYLIQNDQEKNWADINICTDINTQYTESDFPSIVLNTDFQNSNSVKLPECELTVKAGEDFEIAYKVGHIKTDTALLLVTIDYQQALVNQTEPALIINTPQGYLASNRISLSAPKQPGKYEICAVAVPSPAEINAFEPLENSIRFTLEVV
ncbi:MAG: hypothetical protein Q4B85_01895 [Lachnospiraceae bacterium]|nr:hypothetical protein [Lachnospiraceae bacterium]